MWIDATVAASFVTNPNDSDSGRQALALRLAPDNGLGKSVPTGSGRGRLQSPAGTQKEAAAKAVHRMGDFQRLYRIGGI